MKYHLQIRKFLNLCFTLDFLVQLQVFLTHYLEHFGEI